MEKVYTPSPPQLKIPGLGRKIPNTQFHVIIIVFFRLLLKLTIVTTKAVAMTTEQKTPSLVQIFTKYDFSVLWDRRVGMLTG